jgi:hypothetical protein
MKHKHLLGAAAALFALSALPANAQYFGYRPHTITIRENGRELTVDRSDRLYWQLRAGPYHFKDGRVYTYTNNCSYGGECLVRVYDPYSPFMRYDNTTAPPVGRASYYNNPYDNDYDYDND